MTSRQILVRDLLVLFGLTGWALTLPYFGSEFMVSMALTCLMYVALSSSWALFCGSTRYLSLATAAFFGIGAYTGALMLEHAPWLASVAVLSPEAATRRSRMPVRWTIHASSVSTSFDRSSLVRRFSGR